MRNYIGPAIPTFLDKRAFLAQVFGRTDHGKMSEYRAILAASQMGSRIAEDS
jgi:hypothetical protein